MSLYGDYIKERLGDEILETDKGFAAYRFPDPKTVYIVDIYIRPDFRNKRVASDMADSIVEIARGRGCKKMIGSVVPSTRGSTESMKALLGYGFVLDSCANDFVLFRKDI